MDDFCEGLGEDPGEDGEKEVPGEDVDEDFAGVDSESSWLEVLPELLEANRLLCCIEEEGIRYCLSTVTRRRLALACGREVR